ncbi:MAG TPA: Fic family protein [Blastocatellia bacterium]|jgi:hypothetical protein|nr:Fic family protein [Blastocatellia bacterium]
MSHRPPRPLIVARGINDWINRVNQKHEELAKLGLSEEKKKALRVWASAEFAASSLRFSESKQSQDPHSPPGISITALDLARDAAQDGRSARLTSELLRRLHNPASRDPAEFRKGPGARDRFPKPPPPESIPAIVEAMCRWTDADSFIELHPVEQSAIVHLRLTEIQPFEDANQGTAFVAASFFLLRAGLPPLIIPPELTKAYETALDEASRLNTRPMVELVAEATTRTLGELILKASGK